MKKKLSLVILLTIVILFLNNFIISAFIQLPQYIIPFDLDLQINNDNNVDQGEKIMIGSEYVDMPVSCPSVYSSVGWPMVMITNSGNCAASSYHPIGIIINILIAGLVATGLVLAVGRLTRRRVQNNGQ